MFAPVVYAATQYDTGRAEKEAFITFRKNLKYLLRDEYINQFGSCDENSSKNIMLALKGCMSFDGTIPKHSRILNHTQCGALIAEITFVMFKMLCSMRAEYDTDTPIRTLAGIINDVGRGFSAVERLEYAINTITGIANNHELFTLLQESIKTLGEYLEHMGCYVDQYGHEDDYFSD